MLPSEVPRLTTDSPVRVFPGVWKLLSLLRLPSWDGSPSLPLLSLFVFYIFSYLLLKTMGCFSGCLISSAGIEKLFCGIYSAFKCSFDEFVGEKVVSPSYSSAILGPPQAYFLKLQKSAWIFWLRGFSGWWTQVRDVRVWVSYLQKRIEGPYICEKETLGLPVPSPPSILPST